jgi:hypothetical protein
VSRVCMRDGCARESSNAGSEHRVACNHIA